jgi:hypothetical protein
MASQTSKIVRKQSTPHSIWTLIFFGDGRLSRRINKSGGAIA